MLTIKYWDPTTLAPSLPHKTHVPTVPCDLPGISNSLTFESHVFSCMTPAWGWLPVSTWLCNMDLLYTFGKGSTLSLISPPHLEASSHPIPSWISVISPERSNLWIFLRFWYWWEECVINDITKSQSKLTVQPWDIELSHSLPSLNLPPHTSARHVMQSQRNLKSYLIWISDDGLQGPCLRLAINLHQFTPTRIANQELQTWAMRGGGGYILLLHIYAIMFDF